MVNKKAYIRTLEAVVAILILYLVMTSVLSKNKTTTASVPKDIELTQSLILDEIENNDYYRSCVLMKDYFCLGDFINNTLKARYSYNLTLCTKDNCMYPETPSKEIYAKSIIISSNITRYNTTSVNLFLWRKI